ncbi:MAG: S8 family serine peptidase [Candidatus Riflebacteria bacterium]|nr:S8 family serine peptidase [Candidatus Riflebacteria bacterium]
MMFKSFYSKLAVIGVFVFSSCICWGMENSTDRWIVKFKNTSSVASKDLNTPCKLIRNLQQECDKNFEALSSRVNTEAVDKIWAANAIAITASSEKIKTIAKLENVEFVFPVQRRKYIIDDPNSKPVYIRSEAQWGVAKIRAPEVWNKFKVDGSGIVVGQVDTGVDITHPLLAGKVIAFRDFTSNPKPGCYDDHGHGTHTAGTICGSGGVGVAPGARLISAKAFDKNGDSTEESQMKAMQWMMDPDGNPQTNDFPRVVSNSWSRDTSSDGSDPIDMTYFEIVKNWVALGILPVFSAGNSGPSGRIEVPANFLNTWTIGATQDNDKLSDFSSRGPCKWITDTYIKPDVTAPGEEVVSCSIGGGLVSKSGTSMACPHAAGLVALMLQANPKITITEIRKIAEDTSVDLGKKGKDNLYGAGRIDAFACISKIAPQTPLENIVEGYKMALETEYALCGKQVISPLAAPTASYIIEKTKSLDDGEFSSLNKLYDKDSLIKGILKQAEAVREFNVLHKDSAGL